MGETHAEWMKLLLPRHWSLEDPCLYVVSAVLFALLIRVAACLLRASETVNLPSHLAGEFWGRFGKYFAGWFEVSPTETQPEGTGGAKANGTNGEDRAAKSVQDSWHPDYWQPSIIGLIELLTFPILMATGAWIVVGAWVSFKAVAPWGHWLKNRSSFNRHLIGNALVILSAYWLATNFVAISYCK